MAITATMLPRGVTDHNETLAQANNELDRIVRDQHARIETLENAQRAARELPQVPPPPLQRDGETQTGHPTPPPVKKDEEVQTLHPTTRRDVTDAATATDAATPVGFPLATSSPWAAAAATATTTTGSHHASRFSDSGLASVTGDTPLSTGARAVRPWWTGERPSDSSSSTAGVDASTPSTLRDVSALSPSSRSERNGVLDHDTPGSRVQWHQASLDVDATPRNDGGSPWAEAHSVDGHTHTHRVGVPLGVDATIQTDALPLADVTDTAVQVEILLPSPQPPPPVALADASAQTDALPVPIVSVAGTQTLDAAGAVASTQTLDAEAAVASTQTPSAETAAALTQTDAPPLSACAAVQTDTPPRPDRESPAARSARRRRTSLERKQLESVRLRLAEVLMELRDVKADARDMEKAAMVLQQSLAASVETQVACRTRLLEIEEAASARAGPAHDLGVTDDEELMLPQPSASHQPPHE
jgi:hypothetical protein